MKTAPQNTTPGRPSSRLAKGKRWGAALLWMALIFFLSSRSTLPGPDDPLWNILLKKVGHFVVFGVLAWLYLRALRATHPASERDHGIAWGLALLYAASDEIHQAFVPGRTPSPTDWLIDLAGATVALLIARQVQRSPREESGG